MLPESNAATRMFCSVPVRELPAHGIAATLHPPSGRRSYEFVMRRGGAARALLAAMYWGLLVGPRRLVQIGAALRADVIFIQRGMFRYRSRPVLERFLRGVAGRLLGRRIVLHLDDALWAVAPRERIIARCQCADLVITGNELIASFAERAGVEVAVLEGWVEPDRYPVKTHTEGTPIAIGFVGTFAEQHLAPIEEALAELCAEGLTVRVISGARPSLPRVARCVEWTRWRYESRYSVFDRFEVGIMPLLDTEYNRAKEAFKIKEYMAAGLPVVCSPVGQNANVVSHGENGLFATTMTEWVAHVRALAADAQLRSRLGANGRRLVNERYSADVQIPKLATLLADAG